MAACRGRKIPRVPKKKTLEDQVRQDDGTSYILERFQGVDEKDIVEQAKVGDIDAQRWIYETYYPRVYRYEFIRTESEEDAEDLSSEVLLRVFGGLSSFSWKFCAALSAPAAKGMDATPAIIIAAPFNKFLLEILRCKIPLG